MNTRGAILRNTCVTAISCLLLESCTVFAAESTLVIAPQTTTPITPASRPSNAATTTATATETSTSYYSFNHYPANWPYSPTPWSGAYMQGVGLRDDRFLTIWYFVYGIWDYDIEETWEAMYLKPDGTAFDGFRWHTDMETVNGVLEKCYSSYSLPSGTFSGKFCADDPTYGKKSGVNTIGFGTSRYPWNDPIEVDSIKVTHNGVELHTEQYLLSDIGLINPNPGFDLGLIDASGALSHDVDTITSPRSAYRPTYAATDGVTKLYLKAGSVTEIPVTFQFESGSSADGTLTDLNGQQVPTMVQPTLQATTDGDHYEIGLYQSPSEIGTTAGNRPIKIQISYTLPWTTTPTVFFINLALIRPPVVLIHGIWSNPKTWNPLWAADLSQNYIVTFVDWSPGDTTLWTNIGHVCDAVKDMMTQLRYAGFAVTQADVVGHSAGGLLARLWTQVGGDGGYRRVDNFRLGDFRKILTVGTPHQGSEVATLVQQLLATNTSWTNLIRLYFSGSDRSLTNGVITDLAPGSGALNSLRPTFTLALPWVGTIPTIPDAAPEYRMWQVLADQCGFSASKTIAMCSGIRGFPYAEKLRSQVFAGRPNDGLVSDLSQADGLVPLTQCLLSNTVHTEETTSPILIQNLTAFLDSAIGFSSSYP